MQCYLSIYQQSLQLSAPSFSSLPSLTTPLDELGSFSTRWTRRVIAESIPFLADYPRPHLRRQSWSNLNGLWSFTITDTNDTFPLQFNRTVRVPFPIESYLSGVQQRVDATMFLWYKRTFRVDPPDPSHRVLLHFDKVDYETVVYVNGERIDPRHVGGYDPFFYDITAYLHNDDDNEIIVRVWDPSNQWHQARGKQMLDVDDPNSIFYTPCSGIWGTVWLEHVPQTRVDRLQFKTELSSTHVQLVYRVDLFQSSPHPSDYALKIHITQPTGETLVELNTRTTNAEAVIRFPKSNITLWSPENPYLYDVRIDLYEGSSFLERVDSYIGFRQISLCLRRKQICLNRRPYFMLGVLDQGYWPDGLYRAPTDEAYKYDIEYMKRLGFNTLRKHIKAETSRWYYWCDVLGMLVWQDMPSADSFDGYEIELEPDRLLRLHRDNQSDESDSATTARMRATKGQRAKLLFERELKAMIDFLAFHPSIVIWVLFNEEWGQYDTPRLGTWLMDYDPSRLVNAVSGWQDRSGIGHMRDIHDYTSNILLPPIDDRRRALVLGECGGFGLTNTGWSYNRYNDRYFLTYAFEQLIVHRSRRLSGLIYTQLSDVENEANGLLTYDRRQLKLVSDHVQRVLKTDYSRLYKLTYVWNLTVEPYTNYHSLSLNETLDITFPTRSISFSRFYFYTCYLYSMVQIIIDGRYRILLDQAHRMRTYQYVPLPRGAFENSTGRRHSLDIRVRSMPSIDDAFLFDTNRTFFYLSLALLSE